MVANKNIYTVTRIGNLLSQLQTVQLHFNVDSTGWNLCRQVEELLINDINSIPNPLEKEVEMNMENIMDKMREGESCICPNCKELTELDERNNYCSSCGVKFKWEN